MLAVLSLAACKNESLDLPLDHGVLRVLHAIPELGTLDMTLVDADLGQFEFNGIRGINRPGDGNHQVLIDVLLPGDNNPTQRLETLTVATGVDRETTLVLTGTLDDPNVITWNQPARDWESEAANSNAAITELEVSFGNASASHGPLDFYLGPAGFDPADTTPMASLDYSELQAKAEIEADTYELIITPGGDPTTRLYSSGEVALPAATSLVFVAYDSEKLDDNGTPWLNVRPLGGGFTDIRTNLEVPQYMRAVHAGRDAGPVDIVTTEGADLLFGDLAYGDTTDYVLAPTAITQFNVTAVGDPEDIKASFSGGGAPSFFNTVLIGGTADDLFSSVFVDDRRRIVTDARIRVLQSSSNVGVVDIYIVAPNTDIDNVLPSLGALLSSTISGRIGVAAGNFDFFVTRSATKDIVAGPIHISLKKNGIYTAVVSDAVQDDRVSVSFIDDDPLN